MRRTTIIPAVLTVAALAGGPAAAHPPPRIPRDQIPDDMPAHIRRHVEKLYSSNDSECTAAVKALGALGPGAAAAAPFVASVLDRHKTCPTPNAAAEALVRIGKSAVEPTVVALRVGDRYARRRAFDVLAKLKDERAVPAIVASISDGFGGRGAEDALRSIGAPALDYLLKGITSDKSELRRSSAAALPAFASSNVVNALTAALVDSDEGVQQRAAESLIQMIDARSVRGVDLPASDAMFALLRSDDPTTRRVGVRLLARSAGRWQEKTDEFIRLLGDPDHSTRVQAIDAVGWVKEARVAAALATLTTDPADSVRATVATALGRTGREEAVDTLSTMLRDPSASVRENAIVALTEIRGRNAAELLVNTLGNEADPLLRRKVVLLIGRWKDRETVRILAPGLRDDDRGVRYAVVDVLNEAGTNGFTALLGAATNDSAHVRRYVLDKLRNRYEPEVTRTLLSLIDDKDWYVREKATGELADSRRRLELPDPAPIRAALGDSNPRVRASAITILARQGDRESAAVYRRAAMDRDAGIARAGVEACRLMGEVDPLVAAMKHNDWHTREAAAKALASMNTPAARKALGEAMQQGTTEQRSVAGSAMERVAKAKLAPEVLAEVLRRKGGALDARTRNEVVGMGQTAVSPLASLLLDPVPAVRGLAAELLGGIGGSTAAAHLLEALDDEDTDVRERIVDALAATRDKRAVIPLSRMLADKAGTLSEAAAEALGVIGDPAAIRSLAAAAGNDDWHLRCAAMRSLGRIESGDSVKPLLTGLGDAHWYVRQAAAESLGRVADVDEVPRLLRALEDDHWYVRRSARLALFRITGQHFGYDPAEWKKWWESRSDRDKPKP